MSTEAFVDQLYRNFLYRESDEAGKADWVSRIENRTQSPAEVTYAFSQSQEFTERAMMVTKNYYVLFGRVPDTEGMRYWLDKVDEGMSEIEMINQFIASQEFQNRYGEPSNDTGYFQQLSRTALNMDLQEYDRNLWEGILASGQSQADLISQIADSHTFTWFRQQQITHAALYYGILNRAPTEEELAAVITYSYVELVESLYSSTEYAGNPVPEFIPLPIISISGTTVNESDGSVTVTVFREGNTDFPTTVSYLNGDWPYQTVQYGEDLESFSGSVTFAIGESSTDITVSIIDDNLPEADEYFTLDLTSTEGGQWEHNSAPTAYIRILDDDRPEPTAIESFALDNRTVMQGITVNNYWRETLTLTAAGDVNGDGFADFIISNDEGHYLLFGDTGLTEEIPDLDTLNGLNGVKFTTTADENLTDVVDSAGDINGDGFDDLIFGDSSVNDATGQAYLIFGHADSWEPTFYLSEDQIGDKGVVIDGITSGDGTGGSVSGAGDVNNDGFDDLIIGSNGALKDPHTFNWAAGQVHLIYGHNSDWNEKLELSQLDTSEGVAFVGDMDSPRFLGSSIGEAGDINGDGIADIVLVELGNPSRYSSGDPDIYLIYGNADGWDTPYFLSESVENDTVKITTDSGWIRSHSVENAGDINGDGIMDMVISIDRAEAPGVGFVIYGSNTQLPATLDSSSLDSSTGFTVSGLTSLTSTTAIGDINNDGFDDLFAGGYVVYGREEGWYSDLVLEELQESEGLQLSFVGNYDGVGLGDVNGDGIDDFMVTDTGTSHSSEGELVDTGTAYLIFGSDQLFG